MQAVHWFSGAEHLLSDHPPCSSPMLCKIGIWLNDMAPGQTDRDKLWPLVWGLLDSRDPDTELVRTEHITRETVRRILAPLFREMGLTTHADALANAITMQDIQKAAWAAAEPMVPRWAAEAGMAEAAWMGVSAARSAAGRTVAGRLASENGNGRGFPRPFLFCVCTREAVVQCPTTSVIAGLDPAIHAEVGLGRTRRN
jgi:hypothetical protein